MCKQQQCTPIILYKGDILLHITGYPVIDMIIKLGPSTNPITDMFTTELHVCKQQQTPTAN